MAPGLMSRLPQPCVRSAHIGTTQLLDRPVRERPEADQNDTEPAPTNLRSIGTYRSGDARSNPSDNYRRIHSGPRCSPGEVWRVKGELA